MPVNSFETYPMSWKPAWSKERPLYQSLAKRLEADIRSGALLPGTKLPPQRELADFLDINVSTVSQAFRICSDKGLLTSVIGSGTFVAYDAMTNLSLAPDGTEPLIELASMMPETIAVDGVVASLQAMLTEEKAPAFFQYGSGCAAWRRLAALDLLRRAGAVGKEGAVAANGGQNAIVASLLALCRPGDRLGVDPLVYSGLKQAARLLGVRLVPVAQEQGEMSADGIRYAVQNHQIKGLYVVPDFQNPTAHVMSEQGRRTIAQIAEDEGLFIIEDGVARLMAADPLPTIQSLAPERTFFYPQPVEGTAADAAHGLYPLPSGLCRYAAGHRAEPAPIAVGTAGRADGPPSRVRRSGGADCSTSGRGGSEKRHCRGNPTGIYALRKLGVSEPLAGPAGRTDGDAGRSRGETARRSRIWRRPLCRRACEPAARPAPGCDRSG